MGSIAEADGLRWRWPQILGVALLAVVVSAAYLLLFTSDFKHTRARQRMVQEQIAGAVYEDRTPVRDKAVVAAMRTVPRHRFVRPDDVKRAHGDYPLVFDGGTSISQPYIVAFMAELLRLGPDARVLEINLGSGYEAAVLASIASEVYALALEEEHVGHANALFDALGYDNIRVEHGNGRDGWAEHAPYDAIFVRAGVEEIPTAWSDQLKPGGRMVVPLGPSGMEQSLVLIEKRDDGATVQTDTLPVRFMPLP